MAQKDTLWFEPFILSENHYLPGDTNGKAPKGIRASKWSSNNEYFGVYRFPDGSKQSYGTEGTNEIKSAAWSTIINTSGFCNIEINLEVFSKRIIPTSDDFGSLICEYQEDNSGTWQIIGQPISYATDTILNFNVKEINAESLQIRVTVENVKIGQLLFFDEILVSGYSEDTPVEALCKDYTAYMGPSGYYIITPDMIDDNSYRSCSNEPLLISSDSITYSDTLFSQSCPEQGVKRFFLKAEGSNSGNNDVCTSVVTIRDTISSAIQNDLLEVDEDASGTVQLLTKNGFDLEAPGVNFKAEIVNGPVNGTIDFVTTSTVNYVPNPNFSGQDTIVFSLYGNGLPIKACAYDTLFITVNPVNDPPELVAPITDKSIDVGGGFEVLLETVFKDIDPGDHLTYSLKKANGETLPSWILFNPETSLLSSYPVDVLDSESMEIRIDATDQSGAMASNIFEIIINDFYSISGAVVQQYTFGPLAGTITPETGDGKEAGGVEVILWAGNQALDTIITNSEGFYKFENLKAYDYEIQVVASGYTQSTQVFASVNLEDQTLQNQNFTVWASADTPGFKVTEVKVYPNPTNSYVIIETPRLFKTLKVKVFNMLGQEVIFNEIFDSNRTTIDLSGKVNGVYHLMVDMDGILVNKKIIYFKNNQ